MYQLRGISIDTPLMPFDSHSIHCFTINIYNSFLVVLGQTPRTEQTVRATDSTPKSSLGHMCRSSPRQSRVTCWLAILGIKAEAGVTTICSLCMCCCYCLIVSSPSFWPGTNGIWFGGASLRACMHLYVIVRSEQWGNGRKGDDEAGTATPLHNTSQIMLVILQGCQHYLFCYNEHFLYTVFNQII